MATQASYFIKVTAATGTIAIKTTSTSTGTNWSPTLVADTPDFTSTTEFDHGNTSVSGTGWKEISLIASNINTNGVNHFRLRDTNYGEENNNGVTFASTNNATSGDRPYLKLKNVSSIRLLASTGVGK